MASSHPAPSAVPNSPTADLPLSGVTVVEIGQNIAAPSATQTLADLGARVIKVEKPKGDDARGWGPPFWEGAAAMFQAVNRNKLSLTINFREAGDVAALKRFILAEADVVIQSMRPGLLKEQGLDAEWLREQKPGLIWCDLGAFGSVGPLSRHPGYDPLMQAFGGLMSVTGEIGQAPVRTGYSVVDAGTGLWASNAILAALFWRERTGEGRQIDVSLFETALSWMTVAAASYQSSGEIPGRFGSGAASIVPYRAYATQDGYVVVAAGNDGLFARLAKMLGHPEWVEDPRFVSNAQRVSHREELDTLIGEILQTASTSTWCERLEAAGVPNAPVQNIAQALEHPQTRALEIVQAVPDSEMSFVGVPIRFDGKRPPIRSAPPALNEHGYLLDPYRE